MCTCPSVFYTRLGGQASRQRSASLWSGSFLINFCHKASLSPSSVLSTHAFFLIPFTHPILPSVSFSPSPILLSHLSYTSFFFKYFILFSLILFLAVTITFLFSYAPVQPILSSRWVYACQPFTKSSTMYRLNPDIIIHPGRECSK